MGSTLDENIALFTAGQEIIQDASKTGNALRSMSMRIRGYDEETEELSEDLANITGEVIDLTKVTSNNNQGVSLFTDASQTQYKSIYEYLSEISEIYDELDQKSQQQLLEKLFGKNRANVGAAILTNFDAAEKAMNTSIVIPADSSLSYDIELVVSDDFSSTTKKTSVSTAFTIIHFGSDGTSIAFGKLAETSNLLDTGLNARFNADVYGTAVGLAGMPTIPKNADANTYLTPGCYGLKSNSTANTVSNFPLTGVAGRLFVATALGASIKTDCLYY